MFGSGQGKLVIDDACKVEHTSAAAASAASMTALTRSLFLEQVKHLTLKPTDACTYDNGNAEVLPYTLLSIRF